VKVFIELGPRSGNSYFSFCRMAAKADLGVRCYAVDTEAGDKYSDLCDERAFRCTSFHER